MHEFGDVMMPILTRVTWISVWLWLLFCTCNEKQWQTEAWQLTRPGNCPPAAVPSAYHHISHFRNDAVYVNQYSTRDAVWKLSSKLREDVEESRKTTSSKASSKTVATSKPKATNLNTQPDRSELIRFVDLTNTSSWEVISRSFNSTTLRYLFFWQEEFNSLFLKAEQSLFQFTTNIVNKVQRDLRITQAIGDKFVRTVTQVSAEDFIPDLQRFVSFSFAFP